jgi:hypothetical protein
VDVSSRQTVGWITRLACFVLGLALIAAGLEGCGLKTAPQSELLDETRPVPFRQNLDDKKSKSVDQDKKSQEKEDSKDEKHSR